MIINQIYSIDSCDDVELNIKRGSKLEFRLTYDDSKEIEAIVCIIPGGAEDMNSYIYIFYPIWGLIKFQDRKFCLIYQYF